MRKINQAWRKGGYEELEQYFHKDIVIVPPGFEQRVMGRDVCIRSYRDFGTSAIIREYAESEPTVDVWGDTAVATYSFEIAYEVGGKNSRERGNDVFVFSRQNGKWLAVWRTLQATAQES